MTDCELLMIVLLASLSSSDVWCWVFLLVCLVFLEYRPHFEHFHVSLLISSIILGWSFGLGASPLKAHWAALISVSLALSQTPVFTLQDHGYGASALRGVPVYVPAFAGTHCIYLRRDGQAELTWVAGYIPRWSPIQILTRPESVVTPTEPDHHLDLMLTQI